MFSDRNLIGASAAVRHLLESRLHLLAAEEAMANVEGLVTEHRHVVRLRQSLDEMYMVVEDRTVQLSRTTGKQESGGGPAA
jgi:hypothetical protein